MKFLLFSEDEKKLVDEVFNNAMNVLSEEDRGLPQVVSVLPLLRRGIGNKHAVTCIPYFRANTRSSITPYYIIMFFP